ncbi:DNA ligase [Paenibacillus zeisoli]|uniref:DNA ligase n=1 Tax=Paenibacillus zeisoli TaxID=2496267 RepID=A0A3S1D2J9_9BACL|nr:RNA ligase family protein [Paenibacillus zeisoli]RUT35520.1 DNA ligase [Paenibacillus zeisoli]
MRPFTPMSPILTEELPTGEEWVYQLKWDGFRILAWVHEGEVELYSKKMLLRNKSYPDLVQALSRYHGTFLLDGEAVILDGATGKPSFQLMQQRDKLSDASLIRRAAERNPVQYILFDLLQLGDQNLRTLTYEERRAHLQELTTGWEPPLYLADEFEDGELLWNWIVQQGWEGLVCKKRSSKYKEGKEHQDWFKRKTLLHFDVEIVGVIWKEGRVSSLVMRKDGHYFGRVSSGLNERVKLRLSSLHTGAGQEDYFAELPEGIRNADVRWLDLPLEARVSGRETTTLGLLRHPKLIDLGGIPL